MEEAVLAEPPPSCHAARMTEVEHEERTLTVRLDDELLQQFKAVALRKRRPMSEIIREFIQWYVTKEETSA